MIDTLKAWDEQLMRLVNGYHTERLDTIMWLISEKLVWIPVYLLILFGIQKKYGWKLFGLFVLGIVLTVTLSDRISVELFKEVFQRYRPCHNLVLGPDIHVVTKCGGQYGFVSSHAANFFGVAMFTSLWYRQPRITLLLMLWAGLIAYSRVYLGVHYPADVVCGGVLGVVLAQIVDFVVRAIGQKFLRLPVKLDP